MTSFEHLWLWLAAWMIRAIVALLGISYRVRIVSGAEVLDRLDPPVIFSFWHERAFFCARFLTRRLRPAGIPVTVFSSLSRDGELGAKLARLWGLHVVRGSASRGGTAGLRAMYRAVTRRRSSPVVIPDGPRGPVRRAKPGAVVLSQMTGRPIVALAWAADRAWRIGSWDRMWVPRPFARIDVAIAEPFTVPRDLDAAGLDRQRQQLEERLERLEDAVKRVRAGR